MNMDPMEREPDVDQWLDATLSNYSKAEPRPGLESRVLANLQAERSRITSRGHWWWAMGAAAALAAIVVTVLIGESGRDQNRGKPVTASIAKPEEAHRVAVQSDPAARTAHASTDALKHMPTNQSIQHPSAASEPRLAQFPSPRNLSKEELLLVRRLLVQPLNEQSDNEALLQAAATRPEADLSVDSLEIRSLDIPDIEISESNKN
jgi:hypothetical protein